MKKINKLKLIIISVSLLMLSIMFGAIEYFDLTIKSFGYWFYFIFICLIDYELIMLLSEKLIKTKSLGG